MNRHGTCPAIWLMMLTCAQRTAHPIRGMSHRLPAVVVMFALAMAVVSRAPPVRAESDAACRPVRMVGAAVLKQCADQIRSMTLSLHDIKRTPGADPAGRFFYLCPIQHMCEDEPDVWGWFIDEAGWRSGTRDEAAMRELLRHAPGLGAIAEDFAKPACTISTIEIAGLEGRAVCFELAPGNVHAVVAVVAGEDIGFALVFAQRSVGWELLREKVSVITPKFVLQRAVGDASLMKWLR
jgi:hypothetical protein